jgi:selenium-binding protein 1
MRTKILEKLMLLVLITGVFIACERNENVEPVNTSTDSQLKAGNSNNGNGFIHGIVINLDGEDYYFAGPPDGPNGEKDVPGHYWRIAGKDKINGKHFNTGPFGASSWWSSDAGDGDYLYFVHGIIDVWTPELAQEYADKGFVHRHEFVKVADGTPHPSKVIWLKHTAVTSFTLDGGPGAPNPPYEHMVTPGIDWDFPNNYMVPYPEE